MSRALGFAFLLCLAPAHVQADILPVPVHDNLLPLHVSPDGRGLVKSDGSPFFWMGDTAWWLHRIAPEDLAHYLDTRKAQGFNVIQGPILTRDSPDYSFRTNNDPLHPNGAFFGHIDRIVDETDRRGMYSALVVTWGHYFADFRDPESARGYGRWLASRYKARANVIWIVAGEYAIDSADDFAISIWRGLGEGLHEGSEGRHPVTIHGSWAPPPLQTSSTFYHRDPWLAFNMIQSSQGGNFGPGAASWLLVEADYRKEPPKPVVDGEATYERPATDTAPAWDAFGVRRRAYWSVFAGAFGHTYGAIHVINFRGPWREALSWPGAGSMIHLRRLIESRPIPGRVPDQRLVVLEAATPERSGAPGCFQKADRRLPCGVPDHVQATRAADGSYAMVYIPAGGRTVTIDPGPLSGRDLVAWWYRPSDGAALRIGTFPRTGALDFTTPAGPDWVLVLDDAAMAFPAPGR